MTSDTDLTGEIIAGRYRVEARLGSGGMGSVWRVVHLESLQSRALKILHPSIAENSQASARLLREARATAALNSRHVVRIVDSQVGYRHAGTPLPFLVMELLEGLTLKDLSNHRKLANDEVCWIFRQLARGLSAAHDKGIIHRDLKPSNIFVAWGEDDEPLVKLCDFGMAKVVEPKLFDELETGSGELLGTPLYMSPEQLRDGRTVGPETDQWALGLVAYLLLTGSDYFAEVRSVADLIVAVLSEDRATPSSLAPALTPEFDAWFLRSCASNSKARWAHVTAQVLALEKALGSPEPRVVAPARHEVTASPLTPEHSPAALSSSSAAALSAPRSTLPWYARVSTRWVVAGTLLSAGLMTASTLVLVSRAASSESQLATTSVVVPEPADSSMAPVTPSAENSQPIPKEIPESIQLQQPKQNPTPNPFPPERTTKIPANKTPTKLQPSETPQRSKKSSDPAVPTNTKKQPGAACERSAQCESGICFAEVCQ